MNIDIEKAFKSGAKFAIDNTSYNDNFIDYPSNIEIQIASVEYVNGNFKPDKSKKVLGKGK